MKNIVKISGFVSALLAVMLILPACLQFGAGEVTSLMISVDDGPVPPQYFSESSLEIIPDFESRTLTAEYNIFYPTRTEETDGEDISSSAELGEEYFMRFEEITAKVSEIEDYQIANEDDYVGAGNLEITLFTTKGIQNSISSFWSDDQEDIVLIKDFYLEIVNLLVGEVQV